MGGEDGLGAGLGCDEACADPALKRGFGQQMRLRRVEPEQARAAQAQGGLNRQGEGGGLREIRCGGAAGPGGDLAQDQRLCRAPGKMEAEVVFQIAQKPRHKARPPGHLTALTADGHPLDGAQIERSHHHRMAASCTAWRHSSAPSAGSGISRN